MIPVCRQWLESVSVSDFGRTTTSAIRTAGLILMAVVVLAFPALAGDLYVPSVYPTIQAAVDAAASGDTIHIAAGTYDESVTITSDPQNGIDRSGITLEGAAGAERTCITATSGFGRPSGAKTTSA